MIRQAASPNHDHRPAGQAVDMLLLHYTGMPTAAAAVARLCDPAAKVSAHYLVDEDGAVLSLVDEDRRAWHAGIARWAGADDINGLSIGVELVNPGHEFGYRAFPPAQMAALVDLCRDIIGRHPIPPHRVLGHADVAPARRQDPGELFDWSVLAAAGVGLWPPDGCPIGDAAADLADLGYDLAGADLGECVTAFQRHWRPGRLDGRLDDDCLGRLSWLLDRIA
ncbi:MAG: N-acetylmuramoyl-L-alanine amidase [Alphaproteobacteria bacterium]|jgi:N-acetylmuramoyl-L-alanine amidase|nr:N-acetylmuramoyl-L-alanine amidase [Alphaproteobacteria bacterium]MDP6567328.1 N-acetylmuramoyl-L-alanine amidase [Alphaproteobacteria bacterium]MDP6812499.1 N-acetylmuramoyl-L-alanine amidase [Alphaproteobacteria bacterium]